MSCKGSTSCTYVLDVWVSRRVSGRLAILDANVEGVQVMTVADASRTRPSGAEQARSNG